MTDFLNDGEIRKLVGENIDNVVDVDIIQGLVETEEIPESAARMVVACSEIPELVDSEYYQGKVRANFSKGRLSVDKTHLRVIAATDRISTHDQVRGAIPFKGQILTELSDYMLGIVEGTLPSSQLLTSGVVVFAEDCEPIDFEMVLRKYMAKSSTTTSLFHHYAKLGEREFCGHVLPDGLKPNQRLPYLMDTPSTKVRDVEGAHDESVSPEFLFEQGITTPAEYAHIRNAIMEAFGMGEAVLRPKGIILVDTKGEVGKNRNGVIVYIDEVLTPDASRYWLADDYENKFANGQDPISYSKELARGIGTPGQPYTDEGRAQIACRYLDAYQHLTGKRFVPNMRSAEERIVQGIKAGLHDLLS